MHVAILGAGNVGGTLGRRLLSLGHTVTFGVREPERGAAAVAGGRAPGEALPAGASVSSPALAVVSATGRRADAVLLTTPWAAVPAVLQEIVGHDTSALDGIPLLDCTNPLGPGFRVLTGTDGASGAEQVQAMVPGARVVKVFNTTGFANMADPFYSGEATVMPYAGDHADANAVAHTLATALGFEAVNAGPLLRARELEHFAALWIGLAYGSGAVPGLGRNIAFRLVRR